MPPFEGATYAQADVAAYVDQQPVVAGTVDGRLAIWVGKPVGALGGKARVKARPIAIALPANLARRYRAENPLCPPNLLVGRADLLTPPRRLVELLTATRTARGAGTTRAGHPVIRSSRSCRAEHCPCKGSAIVPGTNTPRPVQLGPNGGCKDMKTFRRGPGFTCDAVGTAGCPVPAGFSGRRGGPCRHLGSGHGWGFVRWSCTSGDQDR